MKIVIDARFWGPRHTGLGVYTTHLVEELIRIDHKNDYTLLVRQKINLAVKQFIVNADPYTIREQILLPIVLYQLSPDLVHFPSINVPVLYFKKFVVTVHDLIKHDSRGTSTTTKDPIFYWFKYVLYRFVFWWAVSFAKKIIVPSMAVKDQLNKANVVVTYESA